jgi:hypothetical protein
MWPDQWTISTVDGGRSAQFEHTVSSLAANILYREIILIIL